MYKIIYTNFSNRTKTQKYFELEKAQKYFEDCRKMGFNNVKLIKCK